MDTVIDLQSLADTHHAPFVVIDRDFRIIAVNESFLRVFSVRREDVVGRPCYEVSHRLDRPCYEYGEDCPYRQIFAGEWPHDCLHVHFGPGARTQAMRIQVHPLRGRDGRLYLAETFHLLPAAEEHDAPSMVGHSPTFLGLLDRLTRVAKTGTPVLLLGESGTGKELAAQYIHRHSARSGGPFVVLDCTALTEGLFESEVFGHERGAFTGSGGEKPGLVEVANGGTLFLDEIGELPAAQQAKLLRLLDSGEFRRVGGIVSRKANVRIICATNRALDAEPGFRRDLFYRIACSTIRLPPLRARREDIPELTAALLRPLERECHRRFRVSAEALALLQAYDFPGNIRELRNLLWEAASHSLSGVLEPQDFPSLHAPATREALKPFAEWRDAEPRPSGLATCIDERSRIMELLRQFGGNRRRVAAALGISERTLYRKLKRYGLQEGNAALKPVQPRSG